MGKTRAKVGRTITGFPICRQKWKKYSLKDFKGQYVFIDIWATLCFPCKEEIPYLEEIQEKLKKKNIAFIGIATDLDKDEWIKFIEEKALKGTQLIMDRKWISFMHSYDVATIPRYILLDKEGKIINLNMPRPSNPQCMKILKSLKR